MMRDNRDPKDLQRAIPRAGRKGVGRREWLGKGRVGTAADLPIGAYSCQLYDCTPTFPLISYSVLVVPVDFGHFKYLLM